MYNLDRAYRGTLISTSHSSNWGDSSRDWRITPQMPYSHAWKVSADSRMGGQGWELGASVPLHMDFYLGYLSSWWIGSKGEHPKPTWHSYDLASGVTQCHFLPYSVSIVIKAHLGPWRRDIDPTTRWEEYQCRLVRAKGMKDCLLCCNICILILIWKILVFSNMFK